ncbi:MAG: tRNA adenosine(34) deaminase TadA [Prochlorothrix sp.]|nr:tRNA adenosine(34) deaminase TadA [Prochlorothrix sp.]
MASLPLPPPPFEHPQYLYHRRWMARALELAAAAGAAGEVPVGAVIVNGQGETVAEGENRRERDRDPTAHAEIVALRAAGQRRQDWHLTDCTLYVSLEPCPMCAGAIVQARLACLVYGADDPKAGAIASQLNLPDHPASHHRLTVVAGILGRSAQAQLQHWFSQRRNLVPGHAD